MSSVGETFIKTLLVCPSYPLGLLNVAFYVKQEMIFSILTYVKELGNYVISIESSSRKANRAFSINLLEIKRRSEIYGSLVLRENALINYGLGTF